VPKSTDSYRRDAGPPISHAEFSRDAVVFRVNLGAESRAEPGWLLPLICRRGGVTRREVGAIRVGPTYSEFEISGEAAQDFALAASQTDPRAPHVHIEVAGRAIARRPAHDVHVKPDPHPVAERAPRPRDPVGVPALAEREGKPERQAPPAREPHGKLAPRPRHAHAGDGTSAPWRFERRIGAPHPSAKIFVKPNPRPHGPPPSARVGGSHRGEQSGGFHKDSPFSRPGRPGAKDKWHRKPGKGLPPRRG
jgi:hypothetical protein